MLFESIGKSSYSWAGKTYEEIRTIADQEGSILLIPFGSIEQHGHHLPVSTDTILVNAIAHAGSEQLRDSIPLLITPTLWTGRSPHHLPFGGTISLDTDTALKTLCSVAKTGLENGFNALLFLNGHGGNISLIDDAVSEVGASDQTTEILGLTYFHLASSFVDDIRESDLGGISHGGEFETSLMLHLRPDLVHEEAITGTHRKAIYDTEGRDLFDNGALSVYRPFTEYSESGAIGEPHLATADKGERLYDGLGEELAKLLEQIHDETSSH
ncbi:creatininase family protein [Haladaptatus pallidirubidus]|uniref:Creatininase family protein n=1 Tax=Haladaptatus pallidirubidus TaxID=1008152 RepID=A0AAV3US29_9EURY|nr:creatininase family protein [Haladaptatus pallidirubidus]